MLQRMFCHCHFLQKRPQVSSAGRDKSLLVPLAGVPQERGQISLLPGPINPVISSARPKQITGAPGHLHLVIPDDFGWDAQQQELSDPWGEQDELCAQISPSHSWWEPHNHSMPLAS